ncbi:protein of unknown function [Paraburkholderia kururiensis]
MRDDVHVRRIRNPRFASLKLERETGCASPDHRPQTGRQEQEHCKSRALPASRKELHSSRRFGSGA